MFIRTLPYVLIGTCFSTLSFAFNFLNPLEIKQINPQPKTQKKLSLQNNVNYTNFSGQWSGACYGDDNTRVPFTTTIKNDAFTIAFDSKVYSISGLSSDASASRWHTHFEHSTLNWNEDKSILMINGVGVMKSSSDYPFDAHQALNTSLFKATLGFRNDQLILRDEVITFTDMEQQGTAVGYTCALNRVQ